jgi:hypothetical protein
VRSVVPLLLVVMLPLGVEAQTRSAPPRKLPESRQAHPVPLQAEGTLKRNLEARQGEAPYALLDQHGRVTHYVQPQPGVPLAEFVGRKVRVTGAKAVAPGQRIPLFAAQGVESVARVQANHADYLAEYEEEVAPVAHQEVIPAPMDFDIGEEIIEPYYEGPAVGRMRRGHRPPGLDDCNLCGGWGCDVCGRSSSCLSGFYGRGEYLFWWTEGMYSPALVTTSPPGTTRGNAGVLGVAGTEVLFGDEGLNDRGRSGGRILLGYWWDPGRCHAIEGDYWGLSDAHDNFFASSPGSPILARPYFDIIDGVETSELVAFPNLLRGSVEVLSSTSVQGAGLRKRWNICGPGWCDPCDANGWRYDVTAGYRWMRLDDSLSIREDLVSIDPQNPGSFVVFDRFRTHNTFNGGEVGTVFERRCGRWSYELLGRLALGATHSRVMIDGFTDITPADGARTRTPGGLLTQRSNIGEYTRNDFAVVPELGATVGLQLTSVWRLTCGYSFIYWSNVVRAGGQIDRDVNENLLAPEADPFTGPLRPAFRFNDTDFWAMGVNIGLDASW